MRIDLKSFEADGNQEELLNSLSHSSDFKGRAVKGAIGGGDGWTAAWYLGGGVQLSSNKFRLILEEG